MVFFYPVSMNELYIFIGTFLFWVHGLANAVYKIVPVSSLTLWSPIFQLTPSHHISILVFRSSRVSPFSGKCFHFSVIA